MRNVKTKLVFLAAKWSVLKQKHGCEDNEMDIYSSGIFGPRIFLETYLFVGMRMNSSEKRGQEERKGKEKGEREGRGSEVRPINKQRIDFLPLSAVPGETPSPPPSGYTHLC